MLEQKIQAECLPAPRVSWDERRQSQRQKRVDAVFHQGISQGVSQMCVCVCEKETERERKRERGSGVLGYIQSLSRSSSTDIDQKYFPSGDQWPTQQTPGHLELF